ncbi:hypothetical protein HPP92_001344 [Vanilla planifolia]|uniref:Zinc finger PHD-type domain-containing protein n=1 Tax=Vanilla planifolia TaxID=51239 RepID=A0A835S377_VANPL|nr:hypothetical protein HPP92_001344 [Vanilla planifolia]
MEELLAEVGIQGADFSQSIEHPIPETSVLKQGPRPTAFEGVVLPFEDLVVDRRAAGTPESEDLHVLCPLSVSGSGDGSPASEPIISAAEEQLDTEISGDCMMEAEGDPAVLAMLAARDAEGMTTASGDVISIAVEDTTAGVDSGGCGPVKRKRGRPRKNPETPAAVPAKKKEHEDLCFVCFDRTNQNLVSCNRRGCYKAYHPVCVGRDADFFRSKGKWNCGWHICSSCQKAAHYMCYTCTTSYCKVCITGESKYVSVRGTHGFCQSCHNTVTLIELNKLAFEKEEECQRLRQSIKCGLINRLKVGYIQEKAMVLHAVRVNDSLESEKLRLNHLRDRASETGRRKEYPYSWDAIIV